VNQAIVDAARRWLQEPDAHDHRNSPLDVLDPLFAKTNHTSYSEGYQIAIHAFKVDQKKVTGLRNDALNLVRECAFSANPKVVLRALTSLDNAMHGPMPLLNMTISKEDHAQWIPEQLAIIGILRELTQRISNTLIHLRILETLHWYSRYGLPDVKQQANEAAAGVPNSFDLRLTHSLVQRQGTLDLPEEGEVTPDALLRNHKRHVERRRALAHEYCQQHPETAGCIADLARRLLAIREVGWEAHPYQFLDMMLEAQPAKAVQFCEAVLHDPNSPLAVCFGQFLAHVRAANVEKAVAVAEQVLVGGNGVLCRALADLYGRSVFWSGEPRTDDLAILRRLLGHADQAVRALSVDALRRLGGPTLKRRLPWRNSSKSGLRRPWPTRCVLPSTHSMESHPTCFLTRTSSRS
jgi:hypothetical protein